MATRARPTDCCTPLTPRNDMTPARRDRLVAVCRALGDATRLEVFRLIAAQTAPICVCDIVDRFDVSQPTISHHLKSLRDAGLVKVSRRGVWAFYAVDPEGLELLRDAPDELAPGKLADAS
jgi:ArsR family transcriptional regulator, arsenate/arsenite/antimonite-responsive transcriptional repressor